MPDILQKNGIATFCRRILVWAFEFHVVGDNSADRMPHEQTLLTNELVKMRTAFFIVLTVMVAASGCKPDDEITVHEIPKSASGLDGIREAASKTSASSAASAAAAPPKTASPTRMVVALFQRADAAWFFKVTGAPDEVGAVEAQWQKFIDDVKFDVADGNEQPVWELPEGWTTGPPAPFRFATIKLPESEIEIRISKLGGQQDLLSNVNRWRASQLGLPAATADNVDENFESKTGQGGQYLLFDQQGMSSGQSMGGPFMNRARAGMSSAAPAAPKQTPVKPKIAAEANGNAGPPQFDLVPPEGFAMGKTSPMVVARFVKETDGGKVQISVVPLTAVNKWNDNVNFWRQSVGLEKIDEAKIIEQTQTITVSGIEGKRVELLKDHDGSDQGLVGVMVKKGDLAWFFKMIGKRALVRESEELFDQFLKDFTFKSKK